MIKQSDIYSLVATHQSIFSEEKNFIQDTLWFLDNNPDFWQRSNESGHITASAWIINTDKSQAMLIHHRKLNQWFQPGGHIEATDNDIFEAAVREAIEECGLDMPKVILPDIFDIDIHEIPTKGNVPKHLHYDIRILLETNSMAFLADNAEVKEAKWFLIKNLLDANLSQSIHRMVLKTSNLR